MADHSYAERFQNLIEHLGQIKSDTPLEVKLKVLAMLRDTIATLGQIETKLKEQPEVQAALKVDADVGRKSRIGVLEKEVDRLKKEIGTLLRRPYNPQDVRYDSLPDMRVDATYFQTRLAELNQERKDIIANAQRVRPLNRPSSGENYQLLQCEMNIRAFLEHRPIDAARFRAKLSPLLDALTAALTELRMLECERAPSV